MENNFEGDPYLKISNLLLGAVINSKDLLTYEGKVFMIILFKTVGFQKEADWLSYKQICKYTGIKHKTRISESVKSLVEKNLIIKEGKYFKVNQNFKEWLTLNEENLELINKYYQSKKLRKSVTNDDKKLRKSVTKVTEKRNSKLRNTVTPSTDKTITDKTYTDNNINEVFNYWNKKKIIVHKKLDSSTAKKINAKFKDYAREEILGAINNYSYILADPETYWFNYKWTLKEFMQRGFEKFKDWDIAHENYLRKDKLK